MILRALLASWSVVAGCRSEPLPRSSDGGGADLAVAAPDLRALRCDEIPPAVRAILDANRGCAADADRGWIITGCGLPDGCGGFANRAVQSTALGRLVDQWVRTCGAVRGPCPPPATMTAACVAGRCGPKTTGAPVGERCTGGGDCATGECTSLVNSKLFNGGCCTIVDCDIKDVMCPAGPTCKSVGDGHYY